MEKRGIKEYYVREFKEYHAGVGGRVPVLCLCDFAFELKQLPLLFHSKEAAYHSLCPPY